jgi:hypothetical protein
MLEMRKSGRHSSEAVMKYRPDSIKSEEDYFFGITQDVSKSGACLFLLNEVNVGDRINILDNPVTLDKGAVVKWVKKIQDGIYKAGMMFE